jgi:hypothetical protein
VLSHAIGEGPKAYGVRAGTVRQRARDGQS